MLVLSAALVLIHHGFQVNRSIAPTVARALTGSDGVAVSVITGLSWSLLAREPLVQDPVSFCIGDDGSIYVAESFRQERGVEDNRSSRFWLMDDLQSQTVEDRLRMYEKWSAKREGGMDYYGARSTA